MTPQKVQHLRRSRQCCHRRRSPSRDMAKAGASEEVPVEVGADTQRAAARLRAEVAAALAWVQAQPAQGLEEAQRL